MILDVIGDPDAADGVPEAGAHDVELRFEAGRLAGDAAGDGIAVLDEIAVLVGHPIAHGSEGWRSGDQLYFVADTRRLTEAVAWQVQIGWRQGLRDLARWIGAELVPAAQARSVRGRRVPA